MVTASQRTHYDPVTPNLPVLVPVRAGMAHDGHIFSPRGKSGVYLVKQFDPKGARLTGSSKFLAIAKLFSLALYGKDADFRLVDESTETYCTLLRSGFGNFVNLEKMTEGLRSNNPERRRNWLKGTLPGMFDSELESARVIMWWPKGADHFGPAIFCPNSETAWIASLLLRNTRVCLGCGVLFTPHRKLQKCHNERCGNRHRVARHRQKKKEEEQRRGRK